MTNVVTNATQVTNYTEIGKLWDICCTIFANPQGSYGQVRRWDTLVFWASEKPQIK